MEISSSLFSKKVAKEMKEVLEEKHQFFPLSPIKELHFFIRRWLFLSARAPDAHLLPRKEKERKIFNIFLKKQIRFVFSD